jgi:hypothetical protein
MATNALSPARGHCWPAERLHCVVAELTAFWSFIANSIC